MQGSRELVWYINHHTSVVLPASKCKVVVAWWGCGGPPRHCVYECLGIQTVLRTPYRKSFGPDQFPRGHPSTHNEFIKGGWRSDLNELVTGPLIYLDAELGGEIVNVAADRCNGHSPMGTNSIWRMAVFTGDAKADEKLMEDAIRFALEDAEQNAKEEEHAHAS